jgi:hypothetical protein
MTWCRLGAATITVLALFGCSSEKEVLPVSVLHTIESDGGFLLVPPGSKIADRGSRRDCIDSSGDLPATWRELDLADQSIDEVNGFFRAELPQHGWTAGTEEGTAAGGTATSRWSRKIGGRPVLLDVWIDRNRATLKAQVACG